MTAEGHTCTAERRMKCRCEGNLRYRAHWTIHNPVQHLFSAR